MAKRLRHGMDIFIAPQIIGGYRPTGPYVYDQRRRVHLDPYNINHKIRIYERQVKDWFLNKGHELSRRDGNGFIVLMICLSYFEGVQQYIEGRSSRGRSQATFIAGFRSVYPTSILSDNQLSDLYSQARCGLFHTGMVDGRILIRNTFRNTIEFNGPDIKINPKKMLKEITLHFNSYIRTLKAGGQVQLNFDRMFSVI